MVNKPAPIFAEDWPLFQISAQQPLLRYMDVFKFKDLLETSTLYFRRADKLPDMLEGTVSDEGIHGTSASDIAFGKQVVRGEGYQRIAAQQEVAKSCTFLNCWHINDKATEKMWKAYTSSPESVVVFTTHAQLARALKHPVLMSGVRYITADTPRTLFDERSAFFYKDADQFAFEKEWRLLIDVGMLGRGVYRDDPEDFFRRVPVELSTLIMKVQPHPDAPHDTLKLIDDLVCRYLQKLHN